MTGSTYLFMGDVNRAVPLLSSALDKRAPQDAKGRALLMLDLAQCHISADEPEEAAQLAMTALEAANATLVGPIMARVETMRADLGRWSNLRPVRELGNRLAEVTRGA